MFGKLAVSAEEARRRAETARKLNQMIDEGRAVNILNSVILTKEKFYFTPAGAIGSILALSGIGLFIGHVAYNATTKEDS